LFMVSPAAHAPLSCAFVRRSDFKLMFYITARTSQI
jgi:hypothetical protein